ncbi:hypothetical protein JCM24511_06915 [Saitozyma sp. JCM 24511]|nr:hypothetical protein JCM24511_06915 [Saitozyma sp. JCM 24511]
MASEPERVELWTKATKMWDRQRLSERYLDDLLYTVSLNAPEELLQGETPWTLRISGVIKTFHWKSWNDSHLYRSLTAWSELDPPATEQELNDLKSWYEDILALRDKEAVADTCKGRGKKIPKSKKLSRQDKGYLTYFNSAFDSMSVETVKKELEGIEYYREHRTGSGSSLQEPSSTADHDIDDTESLKQGVKSLSMEGQDETHSTLPLAAAEGKAKGKDTETELAEQDTDTLTDTGRGVEDDASD